jgi:hypothetical protein
MVVVALTEAGEPVISWAGVGCGAHGGRDDEAAIGECCPDDSLFSAPMAECNMEFFETDIRPTPALGPNSRRLLHCKLDRTDDERHLHKEN